MKNTIKIAGIISLMLVIGFSFAACSGGGDSPMFLPPGPPPPDPKLVGTWEKESERVVFKDDRTWELQQAINSKLKGTYAISENTVTMATTHVLSNYKWCTKDQWIKEMTKVYTEKPGYSDLDEDDLQKMIERMVEPLFQSPTCSISGNTLTISCTLWSLGMPTIGDTKYNYIKQGGNSGGTDLIGTWVLKEIILDSHLPDLVLNPTSWTYVFKNDGTWEQWFGASPDEKGTYTTSGNTLTMTMTHRFDDGNWLTKDQYRDKYMLNSMFEPETYTYSISGKTLTLTSFDYVETYTKQ